MQNRKQGGYNWTISDLLQLRIPPFFSNMQKRRGEFLAFLQIPKIFRLRRALRGYFNGFIVFSRYLARRRRKILRFYASRTRFPFTKPMVLLQNTQNFRLRRKSSDQSQIMQKRRGEFLARGGILSSNRPDMDSFWSCLLITQSHGFLRKIPLGKILLLFFDIWDNRIVEVHE